MIVLAYRSPAFITRSITLFMFSLMIYSYYVCYIYTPRTIPSTSAVWLWVCLCTISVSCPSPFTLTAGIKLPHMYDRFVYRWQKKEHPLQEKCVKCNKHTRNSTIVLTKQKTTAHIMKSNHRFCTIRQTIQTGRYGIQIVYSTKGFRGRINTNMQWSGNEKRQTERISS